MLVEIIERPISGMFQEKHFGRANPDSLWVLFAKNESQQWVGSFETGFGPTFLIGMENKVVIIAKGYGYLIDIPSKNMVNEHCILGIENAIADDNRRQIIFNNDYRLRSLDLEGHQSIVYEEYFFDTIQFERVDQNKLYCVYWYQQKGPFEFQIDLYSKEVTDSFA